MDPHACVESTGPLMQPYNIHTRCITLVDVSVFVCVVVWGHVLCVAVTTFSVELRTRSKISLTHA